MPVFQTDTFLGGHAFVCHHQQVGLPLNGEISEGILCSQVTQQI